MALLPEVTAVPIVELPDPPWPIDSVVGLALIEKLLETEAE